MSTPSRSPFAPNASAKWETLRIDRMFKVRRELPREDDQLVSAFIDGQVTARSNRPDSIIKNSGMEHGYNRIKIGDLAISGMNAHLGGLGISDSDGKCSPVYLVLCPVVSIDSRFCSYLLRHMALSGYVRSLVQTIRFNSSDFKFEDLKSFYLPMPPVSEQKAIADYLDRETARIDALIEKKQRMINLLDHRWSNKLREVVEVQPKVEVMQLRRCVEKIVSGNWGGEPGTADVDAICVRAGDFDFRTYSANSGVMRAYLPEDIKKSCLREGDLIIEKSGGGEESPVGRVVEWKSNEVAIPTNFAAGVRANKRVSRKYLLYVFASCYSSRLTTRSIKQTTGIQNLDMGSYLSEKVPVPSLATQEVIVERLDKVFFSIRAIQNCLEKQIEVLRERRQALISAAVTGELEIPEVAA